VLKSGSFLPVGNSWISYRSRLVGGVLEYPDVLFPCYIIYSSFDIWFDVKKVDFVGLVLSDKNNDMNHFAKISLGLDIDWDIELLQVESNEVNFGKKIFEKARNEISMGSLIHHLLRYQGKSKVTVPTQNQWRTWFKAGAVSSERSIVLFADQTYHEDKVHYWVRLLDILMTNLTFLHKVLFQWNLNQNEYYTNFEKERTVSFNLAVQKNFPHFDDWMNMHKTKEHGVETMCAELFQKSRAFWDWKIYEKLEETEWYNEDRTIKFRERQKILHSYPEGIEDFHWQCQQLGKNWISYQQYLVEIWVEHFNDLVSNIPNFFDNLAWRVNTLLQGPFGESEVCLLFNENYDLEIDKRTITLCRIMEKRGLQMKEVRDFLGYHLKALVNNGEISVTDKFFIKDQFKAAHQTFKFLTPKFCLGWNVTAKKSRRLIEKLWLFTMFNRIMNVNNTFDFEFDEGRWDYSMDMMGIADCIQFKVEDLDNPQFEDDLTKLDTIRTMFMLNELYNERKEAIFIGWNKWSDARYEEYGEENLQLTNLEKVSSNFWANVFYYDNLQYMLFDNSEILVQQTYEKMYGKEIRLIQINKDLQLMTESLEDLVEMSRSECIYNEASDNFWSKETPENLYWEEIFVDDNLFIFDDVMWKMFLNFNPIIKYNGFWLHINNKKKFKHFNWNRGFNLRLIDWERLFSKCDMVNFIGSINSERNNPKYFRLLEKFNINARISKNEKWLKEIREKFIKMGGNQLPHQSDLSKYPRKIRLLDPELLSQIDTLPQAIQKRTENIHIVLKKSTETNLSLLKFLGNKSKG
jgi:hypothetical protein